MLTGSRPSSAHYTSGVVANIISASDDEKGRNRKAYVQPCTLRLRSSPHTGTASRAGREPHTVGIPAGPRQDHSLYGVSETAIQDAGVPASRGPTFPDAAYAHAGSKPDRAFDCARARFER